MTPGHWQGERAHKEVRPGLFRAAGSRSGEGPPFLLDASLRLAPSGLARKFAPGEFFDHVNV